jgi:exodeoxyribonuclease VII large subunit
VSQPSFDFGDGYADGAADDTYTVSQLATAINDSLRRRFSDGVWVRGEIQGCYERGPHLYFKLVEQVDGVQASIDVALFAPSRARLRPILQKHRLTLADGLKVRIFGQLDFYAVSGKLSLKMSGLDPRFTLGELALNRDELIRRLTADGVLTANARLPLSPAPLRVGVITSVGSAAWADFQHEIERSGLGFRLAVVDVRVQGEAAAGQIAGALQWFGASPRAPRVDALALIRGGGSRTDLAIFDSEAVALAIAASRRPVLTGLGHEIDRSVADMAAHTALKTPTACATHLVERVTAYAQGMEERWSAVCAASGRHLDRSSARLVEVAHTVHRRTNGAVTRAEERTGERARRVDTSARALLDRAGLRLDNTVATLRNRPVQALAAEARHVDSIESRVRLLDPVQLLQRGWSITRDASGHVVRDVATVQRGDRLVTHFATGTVASTVDDVTVLPPTEPSSPTPEPGGHVDD